jgi:hypothetical protein
MSDDHALGLVKALHTVLWAFFAACIVAIPIMAYRNSSAAALILIGVVLIEVLVIVLNDWRCPLTNVAARYTPDRRENFDIYLPLWLAKHNKTIFGALYVAGVLYTVVRLS